MRPLRLELEGFRSYRKRQTLEFPERGLLAITGATGSGKSSLLEAMLFALFGTHSGSGRSNKELIADQAEEMRVSLTFETRGRRLQATRSVARRGQGFFELCEGERRLAHDGPGLTRQVEALLGLDQEQFQKAVILPQGAFHQLLVSRPKDRGELLRRLLQLDAFESMELRLQGELARARQVVERAEWLRRRLPEHPGDLFERHRAEREACQQLRRQRAAWELGRLSSRLDGASLQRQLAEARAHWSSLEARGPIPDWQQLRQLELRQAQLQSQLEGLEAEGLQLSEQLSRLVEEQQRLTDQVALAEQQWRAWSQWLQAQRQLDELQRQRGELQAEESRLQLLLQVIRERVRQAMAGQLAQGLKHGDPCPLCQLPWSQSDPTAGAARVAEPDLREQEELLLQLGGCHSRLAALELEGRQLASLTPVAEAPPPDSLQNALRDCSQQRQRLEARLWVTQVEREKLGHERSEVVLQLHQLGLGLTWSEAHEIGLQRAEARQRLDSLEHEWASAQAGVEGRSRCLDILGLPPDCAEEALRQALTGFEQASPVALPGWGELDLQLGRAEQRCDESQRQLQEAERLDRLLLPARAHLEQLQRLTRLLSYQRNRGVALTFPQWLLQRRQGELLELASEVLEQLTFGQFRLGCPDDDVSALQVVDLPSGRWRSVGTLSGGETFLASLALALALSELVGRNGGALEALFLDEGFGTLSQDCLDKVLQALEMLSRGRLIGVISHVPLVAERVEAAWVVRKGVEGSRVGQAPSRLRQLVEPVAASLDPQAFPLLRQGG